MKIDQSDPNWHFAEHQNLYKTTRPKQKIILLNFEQNDQKEASEPDHVMLDGIKMSKTAATTQKELGGQLEGHGSDVRPGLHVCWVVSWEVMVRRTAWSKFAAYGRGRN